MPDARKHRGPHPQDDRLFAPSALPALREAVAHLSWLLSRGYAERSAAELVGNRFSLVERQRLAIRRCACAEDAWASRRAKQAPLDRLEGAPVFLDGFNVLTTVEAGLGGGVLLVGRDGCMRDLSSIHGTYRKVAETIAAVEAIGETLADAGAGDCHWLLDTPVSNSGRLKTMLREVAEARGWRWDVELAFSPDRLLKETSKLVATADSAVIDGCRRWVNLARAVVARSAPKAWVVDLSLPGDSTFPPA